MYIYVGLLLLGVNFLTACSFVGSVMRVSNASITTLQREHVMAFLVFGEHHDSDDTPDIIS